MSETELEEKLLVFAKRVMKQKKLVFSKERCEKQIRMGDAALLWLSSDISRGAYKRMYRLCEKKEIPLICILDSQGIEEELGIPGAKVLAFKGSSAGIGHFLQEIRADLDLGPF